ncbi:hypothetical protein HMPREF1155_1665 [Slackia sp. CM382]|nr:hypothetical protein HMPREF1155_1665 [Slackia sp. CM382]
MTEVVFSGEHPKGFSAELYKRARRKLYAIGELPLVAMVEPSISHATNPMRRGMTHACVYIERKSA